MVINQFISCDPKMPIKLYCRECIILESLINKLSIRIALQSRGFSFAFT